MEQRREDQPYRTTIEDVERRLNAAGGRKAADDPFLSKMLRRYKKGRVPTDEEIRDMMDKALGDTSVTEELYKIR